WLALEQLVANTLRSRDYGLPVVPRLARAPGGVGSSSRREPAAALVHRSRFRRGPLPVIAICRSTPGGQGRIPRSIRSRRGGQYAPAKGLATASADCIGRSD